MKTNKLYLAVLIVSIFFGVLLESCHKTEAVQPELIIYKFKNHDVPKGCYADYLMVNLDDNMNFADGIPGPYDIYSINSNGDTLLTGRPLELNQGFWFDRRGINPNLVSVFNITLKEYSSWNKTLLDTAWREMILDDDPIIEAWQSKKSGGYYPHWDTETIELINELIETDNLDSLFVKVK